MSKYSGVGPIVPPGLDYNFESTGRRSTTPNSCPVHFSRQVTSGQPEI